MRVPHCLLASLVASFCALVTVPSALAADSASALAWPALTKENKPWTRWWWPGSAVDKASLTWQLEKLAAAGIGGVEITPIYGAKGAEARYIDFLSPKWMEMLEHVGREAQRLGLGVDMATGTGWPFGGPWIDEANALKRAVLKDGKIVGEASRMMVKRAAPGGEGLVVDPFSVEALRGYLAPFDQAFANFPRGLVRGQFHDSFEYFNASWTAKLPEVFRAMHGYDIQQFAAELTTRNSADVKTIDRDTLARIKSDYRDTLAALHLDYLKTWVKWSHDKGWLVRNQSHGAPANLLDLYGAVDIPETETFGSTPFPIPGLRRNADEIRTGNEQDLPEPLVMRMASSAAHVMGRKLASSESATWLRDHWKVSLAYVKPELDSILVSGINHIFYHGTVFSPQDAAWPGWLFYASTQFNPNNTWWDDFGALNRYIARVQSVLQAGQPDNDILLYWPLADVWDNADGLAKMLTVHDVKFLTDQPVGKLARALSERGYQFDYISDAQLQQATSSWATIKTAGGDYRAIIVPKTRKMPLETLQCLLDLADKGGTVIFMEDFPTDVPGYGRLAERRAKFKELLASWEDFGSPVIARETGWRSMLPKSRQREILGMNCVTIVDSEKTLLTLFEEDLAKPFAREAAADFGLSAIRRRTDQGHDYFLTNLTAKSFSGWVKLGRPASSVVVRDPLTRKSGLGIRRNVFLRPARPETEAFLQIEAGQSLLLNTLSNVDLDGPRWSYQQPAAPPAAVTGRWSISFTQGGPELPPALTTAELKSWTELGGDPAKLFGGTARYRLEFDAPATKADAWLLDLGEVRESARVRLNGHDLGTAWSIPFQLRFEGALLKPTGNVLELDVTNLAANRIRDLDQRKVDWKIMREINFVNINYRPFDASGWPLTPSGLLGPVTLTPLRALAP
ncbi:MAG: glycosyl hydrolase [Opitutaceae bacterium]|nr:glycosyl hydrolase [Opitutaceae bacterium]